VAIKIGIDMGAIKDLVGLVTQLTDSVKDRKFASELRNIQSMIGSIQSEHAQMHEQRIKLMTENAELKQKIISLEQEILDINQGITASNNQSISKITNEEEKILLLLSETDKTSAQQIAYQLSIDLTKTKYWLTKLVEDDMLSLLMYVNQPALYYLAQGGRGYLVKNELI
jgi:predicted HTH transcriptional regulator